MSPTILSLPSKEARYTLDADANDRQIGCLILQQQDEKVDEPIRYWQHIINDRVRNLDTTRGERLVLIWAILLLHLYLAGSKLTVCSNHDSPKWIFNLADASGKLARWRLRLMEYDFFIIHQAGVEHQEADDLSRAHTEETDDSDIKHEIAIMAVATSAQMTLSKIQDNIPEQTHIKIDGPQLPKLDDLISARGTDAYCSIIGAPVRTTVFAI